MQELRLHDSDIKMWDIVTCYTGWHDSVPHAVMLYVEAEEMQLITGEGETYVDVSHPDITHLESIHEFTPWEFPAASFQGVVLRS